MRGGLWRLRSGRPGTGVLGRGAMREGCKGEGLDFMLMFEHKHGIWMSIGWGYGLGDGWI